MKIVLIGNREAVTGFALVGILGTAVSTPVEANQALENALRNPEAGIVLITQDVAAMIEARIDQLKLRSTVPLVVEIPGLEGVSSDRPSLNELVAKAIGVKL
jgi:V/A-type H+-transporting ATPase subunit F